MDGWVNEWMNELEDGMMDAEINGQTDEYFTKYRMLSYFHVNNLGDNIQLQKFKDGEWVSEWVSECVSEWVSEWVLTLVYINCLNKLSSFAIVYQKLETPLWYGTLCLAPILTLVHLINCKQRPPSSNPIRSTERMWLPVRYTNWQIGQQWRSQIKQFRHMIP